MTPSRGITILNSFSMWKARANITFFVVPFLPSSIPARLWKVGVGPAESHFPGLHQYHIGCPSGLLWCVGGVSSHLQSSSSLTGFCPGQSSIPSLIAQIKKIIIRKWNSSSFKCMCKRIINQLSEGRMDALVHCRHICNLKVQRNITDTINQKSSHSLNFELLFLLTLWNPLGTWLADQGTCHSDDYTRQSTFPQSSPGTHAWETTGECLAGMNKASKIIH